MALLVTVDNRPIFVKPEQAVLLWLVKTGERRATPKTKAKVEGIARFYLNRATAPPSYLQAYPKPQDPTRKPKPNNQIRLPYVD